MNGILDFFASINILELSQDIRVLIAAGVLFLIAAFFRWRATLLLLFLFGASITIIRFTHLNEGGSISQNLIYFSIGTAVVAIVLIYNLFIRSD